jgi:hypothetical protein
VQYNSLFFKTNPNRHGQTDVLNPIKTSIWFLTFEFVAICLVSWMLSSLLVHAGACDLAMTPSAFAFTRVILFPNTWILFCPAPWLLSAIFWSWHDGFNRERMLLFQYSILTATILLLCTVVVACALPFMTFDKPLLGYTPVGNGE